ncbi:MAG: hypothetical protein KDA78_16370 [Planctomycetaceae bacterium]|nr:hypothetical protein [Planctomycetaceae bacterium]
MTESEQQKIIETVKKFILADPQTEIGPISEKVTVTGTDIWIQIASHQAYLGSSYAAAMLTAQLSDWWIPSRDGNLLDDDRKWFETRAEIGMGWENRELRMFKEERRTRLALNIGLATNGELDIDQGN